MELFAIQNAADLVFSNPVTGEVEAIIEYANTFGVTASAEVQYAMENGNRSVAFSKGKEGSITLSSQVADPSLFAMILGSEIVTSPSGKIHKKKVDVVTNGKVTLDGIPLAGSVCALLPDERKLLKLGELVGEDTITILGKDIGFDTQHNGKPVKIYYIEEGVNVSEIVVLGNSTPKTYKLTAITEGKGKISGKPIIVDMEFPRVTPKTEFNMELGSDSPSEFNMELDVLQDSADRLFIFRTEN